MSDNDSLIETATVKSINNLKIGDCLIFNDTALVNFGLILIENHIVNKNRELSFSPVRLDKAQQAIEQFSRGQVYVNSYPDMTTATGKSEGMTVFHFLSYSDFEPIFKQTTVLGNLKIRAQYLHITGGTIALTKAEFLEVFKLWKELFGQKGRLANLNELIHKN